MIFDPSLKDALENKLGLAYYRGSELITYCPWCEPKSTRNHGHLYISTEDPVAYCFKEGKGRTLMKVLRQLGLSIEKYINSDVLNRRKNFIHKEEQFEEVNYLIPEITKERELLKRNYLKMRLGIDYNIDKIPGLIFDFEKFLNENKIEIPKDNSAYRLKDYIQNSFVGFLSTRGKIISFRNINTNSDFRYFKFNLGKQQFFKDFYGIKTGSTNKQDNIILLAEGIFDILVGFGCDEIQKIKNKICYMAAIFDNHYDKAVVSVLDYCKLPSAKFIILSDGDKKEYHYKKMINNPSVKGLEIWWNSFGKDFGELPIKVTKKIF